MKNNIIAIETTVHASRKSVWKKWTSPEDIVQWNYASEDWHTPKAENDLRPGGRFMFRMEAKDGSFGFDFGGIYDKVEAYEEITYTLGDGRKVAISFSGNNHETTIHQEFEAETVNSLDKQRLGRQAILDNFKEYVEAKL